MVCRQYHSTKCLSGIISSEVVVNQKITCDIIKQGREILQEVVHSDNFHMVKMAAEVEFRLVVFPPSLVGIRRCIVTVNTLCLQCWGV
jgi:hypothetical protein